MGVPRQTAALLVAIVAASGAATASSDLASAQGSAPDLSRLPLAAPGGISLEQPFLLYEQQLPTGAVKRVYSDASVFVGDARARLSFHVNGLGLTDGMWSAEPEPASRERIVELAGQYTLRHRSLGSDAEAAGIDDQRTAEVGTRSVVAPNVVYRSPNVIYSSGCMVIDNAAVYWYGCYRRKGTNTSDPDSYYMADAFQASGSAKPGHVIASGWAYNQYTGPEQVVQWAPAADLSVGSCKHVSLTAGAYGASFTLDVDSCPDKIHPSVSPQLFRAQWVGWRGCCSTVGTTGASWAKAPVGYAGWYYSGIGAAAQ